jgi:hypothetical protein
MSLSLQAEDIGRCYQERANLIAVWDSVHEKAGKAEAEYKKNDLYSLHVKQRTADVEYEKSRKLIDLLAQKNLQAHISRVESNEISKDMQENRELALWFFDATSAKMIKDIRNM